MEYFFFFFILQQQPSSLHYGIFNNNLDATMVLGSFGATAVLVYGYPGAPFSQPKNVIFGHFISAACGIGAHIFLTPLLGGSPLLAAPVAGEFFDMILLLLCWTPPCTMKYI